MSEQVTTTTLDLKDGYRFLATFDESGMPALLMDEPSPLGNSTGPNATRVLAAAIGNCLSASALHCLRKAHIDVNGMHTEVEMSLTRNPQRRMRVDGMKVHIAIDVPVEQRARMTRCMGLFEDFCVVTESVRHGIPVLVDVDVPSLMR